MNQPNKQSHKFPLVSSMLAMTVVAGAICGACVAAVPVGLSKLLDKDFSGDVNGIILIAMITWISALIGVIPISLFGSLGAQATVKGWFVGTGIKIVLSIVGGVALIKIGGFGAEAVLVSLALMYLTLLPTSMYFVLNYLRAKDGLGKASSELAMETSV